MGAVAAKMTMDATIWLAENRSDLSPEVSVKLAQVLGGIAERQKWVAPASDVDLTNHNADDIQAFLDNSDALRKSVMIGELMPEDTAALFSSIANFMGYKVASK